MPDDVMHVDSWFKFAIFVAGSAWVAIIGVAAFWAKRVIVRRESEADRPKEKSKHNSHAAAAPGHSHSATGRDHTEIQ